MLAPFDQDNALVHNIFTATMLDVVASNVDTVWPRHDLVNDIFTQKYRFSISKFLEVSLSRNSLVHLCRANGRIEGC